MTGTRAWEFAGAPGQPAGQGALEVGELRLDAARRSVILAGEEVDLTRREFELLHLLIAQRPRVVAARRRPRAAPG